MTIRPMTDIDAYLEYKRFHKWFNKLWFSEAMGYDCGPASIAPSKSGWYIVRPIMNLSGMSVNAKKVWIDAGDVSRVQPGYFWCEWFDGEQYSVTYSFHHESPPRWEPLSCWKAERDVENLSKFKKWTKCEHYPIVPPLFNELTEIELINIEFIDFKPIEIHLRTSPDPDFNELIPVWKGEEYLVDKYTEMGYTYIKSFDNAEGFLDIPRIGFLVKN